MSTSRGLANVPESAGIFVMYSAASNTNALDRLSYNDKAKYSVFTRTLLPLIGRTDLSIQELSNELKNQVWKLAQSAKRMQRPAYYDGLLGRFSLPGCAMEADKTTSAQPGLPSEKTGKDGAPMVLIPAGTFQMGSTNEEVDRAIQDCVKELEKDQQACEGWYKPELPQHKVQMGVFYFDRYEVTNRLFQQFTQQTGYRTTAELEGSAWAFVEGKGWEEVKSANWQKPEAGATVFDSNRAEHPVVSVSWDDAQAYCWWWENGSPQKRNLNMPYVPAPHRNTCLGEGNPGGRRVENIADESAKHLLKTIMSGYHDGAVRTAPVGSYEANPWGLHDISGNAREWTADWYDGDCYSKSSARDPTGPSSGQYRVLRSGSWSTEPVYVRSADRGGGTPTSRDFTIGFRCAQDIPK